LQPQELGVVFLVMLEQLTQPQKLAVVVLVMLVQLTQPQKTVGRGFGDFGAADAAARLAGGAFGAPPAATILAGSAFRGLGSRNRPLLFVALGHPVGIGC
jgi:hypothetical protein